ncbi:hypothetical protein AOG23_20300 [Rhizobium acidisoli]|nr:hypothetical protein AOG23_20300 [Rhizobium acidisoli]
MSRGKLPPQLLDRRQAGPKLRRTSRVGKAQDNLATPFICLRLARGNEVGWQYAAGRDDRVEQKVFHEYDPQEDIPLRKRRFACSEFILIYITQ